MALSLYRRIQLAFHIQHMHGPFLLWQSKSRRRKSAGMLRRVIWQTVTQISRNHSASVFRDQAVSTWRLDPWRRRFYDTEIMRNVLGDCNLPRTPLWEYQIWFWNFLSRINHWIFGLHGPGFESRKRQDFFLLSKQCGPAMGPTHPPIQRVMVHFFAQAQMGWGVTWPLVLLLT